MVRTSETVSIVSFRKVGKNVRGAWSNGGHHTIKLVGLDFVHALLDAVVPLEAGFEITTR